MNHPFSNCEAAAQPITHSPGSRDGVEDGERGADVPDVEPGADAIARLRLGREAFRRWDLATSRWVVDPGRYELIVASSAAPEADHQRVVIDVPSS